MELPGGGEVLHGQLQGAWLLRERQPDEVPVAASAHGLRGLDATVTFAATGAITRAMVQPTRG